MASWEDDEDDDDDLKWETSYEQTVWQQLQQQHTDLQLSRNPSISNSGRWRGTKKQREFDTFTANDAGSDQRKVPPLRHYHSHLNSGYSDRHDVSTANSLAPKNRSFNATAPNRSTQPVDYIKLNRHQLRRHNHGKSVYPQKTYGDMYSKKQQRSSVGSVNYSRKNVFEESSSLPSHEVDNKLFQSARSYYPSNLPQYQYVISRPALMPYDEPQSPAANVLQKYSVLPPISAYAAQPTYSQPVDKVQRVSVDITVRLPEDEVAGHLIQSSYPMYSGAPATSVTSSQGRRVAPTQLPAAPTRRSDVSHRGTTRPPWQ